MLSRSECSKKFKKICDRTISTTKKEIHTAKDYSNLWSNYSTIRDLMAESRRRLNSMNSLLQYKTQNVNELKQLDKDRQEELEHIKEEINILTEKIATLQSNESQESQKMKSLQQQLLKQMIFKVCTKTYINDKSLPHRIRGFTASEEVSKMIPFEIDPERITKSELENAMWENSYRCCGYANEWNQLFTAESNVDS